ncbi:short chain dehydrogenase reductase family superfamily [Lentinula edodes]|uniref:Short chain dehydrogenase reductase family superfamily n=1 Tax=Lentinula edodes TaxID=5353 RepID=A0A1Q3DXB3_LENED|nr:short chain dehydrogenase reductase family superfamily [Lentinula edodes]
MLVGLKFNSGRPSEDAREAPGMTLVDTPKPPQLQELYCNVTEDIADFVFSWFAFHGPIPIETVAVGLFNGSGMHIRKTILIYHLASPAAHIRKELGPDFPQDINIIPNIDLTQRNAGERIVSYLKGDLGLGVGLGETRKLDLVIMNAGVFKADTLENPNWEDLLEMHKVVSIAPLMVASNLYNSSLFATPSKFVIITSEGGSIALRTRQEGGGNYGHHSSKAAANMVGKLLSNDLYDKQVTVGLIHPGFMKTDMTKGVGYDEFYDSGGAVEPSEAAETTVEFIMKKLSHDLSGTFYAPRGPR